MMATNAGLGTYAHCNHPRCQQIWRFTHCIAKSQFQRFSYFWYNTVKKILYFTESVILTVRSINRSIDIGDFL